jgi:hypothetical protein
VREWISYTAAAKRMGVSPRIVRKLVETGRLSSRMIPETWPKVRLKEVDAIVLESTREATA